MGPRLSKPEFVNVLADKEVQQGACIELCCEVTTENISATWEKDGRTLRCVYGRHSIKQDDKKHTLVILDAQASDEGKYTINLSNESGSDSCSAMVRVALQEWRSVQWNQELILNKLKQFKTCDKVKELRFLLVGPVGAGKSSTINTIKTIFAQRQFISCQAAAASSKSHTLHFKRFEAEECGLYPFAFHDMMGVEEEDKDGLHTKDVTYALKGHLKEGYIFNPYTPVSEDNKYFNKKPTVNDQMHCLMYVIPADKIGLMGNKTIQKLKDIRKEAIQMGVTELVFMTRVDCICPMTKKNLRNVYKSKKIREKMQECSNIVGIPVNCIFPVQNYNEETHLNENTNCLMLDAFSQIVNWANDYVESHKGSCYE